MITVSVPENNLILGGVEIVRLYSVCSGAKRTSERNYPFCLVEPWSVGFRKNQTSSAVSGRLRPTDVRLSLSNCATLTSGQTLQQLRLERSISYHGGHRRMTCSQYFARAVLTSCAIDYLYSNAYIKEILAMLKSMFIEYRPGDVPDFPDHTVIPKREKQWLGFERQMSIEPHIPPKYRLAIRTLLTTGMRPGELRAIQVNDLVDGSIKIWKAISDNGLRLARKSGGEVTYRVPVDLWEDLKQSIKDKQPGDFIFSLDGVNPLGKKCLYKVWEKACEDAKVKYIPLQQASRHSMATEIMAEHKKKAIEEIQAKLGHHNRTTQKHYIVE